MSLIFHPLPDFSPIVPAAVTPTSAAKVVSGTRRPLLRAHAVAKWFGFYAASPADEKLGAEHSDR